MTNLYCLEGAIYLLVKLAVRIRVCLYLWAIEVLRLHFHRSAAKFGRDFLYIYEAIASGRISCPLSPQLKPFWTPKKMSLFDGGIHVGH